VTDRKELKKFQQIRRKKKYHFVASQNDRITRVGRDLWRSSSLISC